MNWESIIEYWNAIWADPRNTYLAVVICLFLLVFLVVFIFRPRKGKSVLAYEDANGRVEVSRAAINELVQSTCQQIETITQPKVITYVKKGIPALRIKLKVQGDARMKEIRERLRSHLRAQLMENLGFEKLGPIDILVTSVGNLPVMAPPAQMSSSEPASAASTGYQSSSSVAYSTESTGSSVDEEIQLDDEEFEPEKKNS